MNPRHPARGVRGLGLRACACACACLFAVGCPTPILPRVPPEMAPVPEPIPIAGAGAGAGTRLVGASAQDLVATVEGPRRAPYEPDALGFGGGAVTVRMTNVGANTLALRPIRFSFSASREGVSFPCREHVGGSVRVREPATLAPKQAFVFARDIDCALSLPGAYDIRVFAQVGDAASRGVRASDQVGAFRFELETGPRVPRPYPAREGLHAMMTGGRLTRPLHADAWARGDYHVLVAVMNASKVPVAVGAGRVAFLTYRAGSSLPCSGQAELVRFPDRLAPGALHVVRAPVACAPSVEGQYEIVGRLTLDDVGEELEIGRIALTVSGNPLLFEPGPWPSTFDSAGRR